MPEQRPISIVGTVVRGLRLRCPRCGGGKLFAHGYRLQDRCDRCGLRYAPYAEDTWAMMYFSTAALTGTVVIGLIVARPRNLLLGRLVLGASALAVIVLSLPFRKGAAIAVNWLVSARSNPAGNRVSSDRSDC